MNEFAFRGAESDVVVFAFRSLLLEERLEIGIVLPCDEGCVEEERTKGAVAALGKESFAMDGCTALVHTAIHTDEGNEFLRGREAMDISDMRNEGGGADGADTGDGLQEFLCVCTGGSESFLCLFEGFLQRSAECGEDAVELLLRRVLVGVLDMKEIGAFSFELGEGGILSEQCFETEDFRRIGEWITVAGDEDAADGSGVPGIVFNGTKGSLDGSGRDVWVDDRDVPAMIGQEHTKKEMIDAGGFEADTRCIRMVPLV